MLQRAPIIGPGSIQVPDDEGWLERQTHWDRLSRRSNSPQKRGPRLPLIIAGYGACLKIEHGALIVRNGRTHHPHKREEHRFFRGDQRLPTRIIVLDGSGLLSFDVLTWLSEQRLPIIRIDWRGSATCIIGGAGSAYLPEKVAWQMETRRDPQARLEFACQLIVEKLIGTLTTLRTCLPQSRDRDEAVLLAERTIDRLRAGSVKDCTSVFLAEARAAGAYFKVWKTLPIRWKRTDSRPVPDHWRRFNGRRSRRPNAASNRNATHPVNALLNYGYALLHGEVQLELVAAGFDPARGLLHESRADAMAAVLDFIEPRRPQVDAAVLQFVSASDFHASDFPMRSDGGCRISPGVAKALASKVAVTSLRFGGGGLV